jgi:hypothetical protein
MKSTTATLQFDRHFHAPESLMKQELLSRRERGCDITDFEGRFAELLEKKPELPERPMPPQRQALAQWEAEVGALYRELSNAPLDDPNMSRAEPSAFVGIKNTAPRQIEAEEPTDNAWKGRLEAACRFLADDMLSAEDDTNQAIANCGLEIVAEQGHKFLPDHVGEHWMNNVAPGRSSIDNKVAYANFLNGLTYPRASTTRNPWREQDGALARGTIYGLMAPSNPRRAARMAFHDAALSHTRSGIFAAMAIAAGISWGLVHPDTDAMLQAAADVIPAQSRTAAMITGDLLNEPISPPYDLPPVDGYNSNHAIIALRNVVSESADIAELPTYLKPVARIWHYLSSNSSDVPTGDDIDIVAGDLIHQITLAR